MLDLVGVRKTFNAKTVNEKTALNGLDLHLSDGDFVTVIGGNGAGKSTMLNAIAGVWPVDGGSIVIDGEDVTRLPEHRRAALLGRVFQDPMTGTAATMQIEENLALAARRGERRTLKSGITREERAFYRDRLAALGLGLENRMTAKVGLLSGGQRQALTLLMATLKKPKLLLLDEHTAALDPRTSAKVLEISERIVADSPVPAGKSFQTTGSCCPEIRHGVRPARFARAGRTFSLFPDETDGEIQPALHVPDDHGGVRCGIRGQIRRQTDPVGTPGIDVHFRPYPVLRQGRGEQQRILHRNDLVLPGVPQEGPRRFGGYQLFQGQGLVILLVPGARKADEAVPVGVPSGGDHGITEHKRVGTHVLFPVEADPVPDVVPVSHHAQARGQVPARGKAHQGDAAGIQAEFLRVGPHEAHRRARVPLGPGKAGRRHAVFDHKGADPPGRERERHRFVLVEVPSSVTAPGADHRARPAEMRGTGGIGPGTVGFDRDRAQTSHGDIDLGVQHGFFRERRSGKPTPLVLS